MIRSRCTASCKVRPSRVKKEARKHSEWYFSKPWKLDKASSFQVLKPFCKYYYLKSFLKKALFPPYFSVTVIAKYDHG